MTMVNSGEHTWDIVLHYHSCPQCGYIIESRKKYKYNLGKYYKKLKCDRCSHSFIIEKAAKPSFGPLFGDAQPKEIDWS